MRGDHRVLIFEKSGDILRYNRADIVFFFHRKRHVSPITRQRSSATRDPRNSHCQQKRSIDDVDIEHYNFCIQAWRITSVLFRESEYKFRLLRQTCREKVPDSRRARKQRLCASKRADEKVWEKLLIRPGERSSHFLFFL